MSKHTPTCHDCYFHRHALCALALERPCPTFRPDGRTLEPPRQPQLVSRPPLGTALAAQAAYAA